MFRFEDHMPSYWLNESRDFQLMTRLDDAIFMGQRGDIATITNINSGSQCKDNILPLLAKRVGFFTNKYIKDDVLRSIIGSFRLAVKNKGTKKGILYAVSAILMAENNSDPPEVDIDNYNYEINIYTPVNIENKEALREFLKYIVPTGFIINIYSYHYNKVLGADKFNNIDQVVWAAPYIESVGIIRKDKDSMHNISNISNESIKEYMSKTYFGSENLGMVVSLDDLKHLGNNFNSDRFEKYEKSSSVIVSNKDKDSGNTIIKEY